MRSPVHSVFLGIGTSHAMGRGSYRNFRFDLPTSCAPRCTNRFCAYSHSPFLRQYIPKSAQVKRDLDALRGGNRVTQYYSFGAFGVGHLFFTRKQPLDGPPKLTTDCEQDFSSDFSLAVLDS